MTTQGAIFNYEEVIDLHTEVGRVSVIGLHTPTGDTPRVLCPGFFQQFKRYKYLGCSISVVPVATLPADPLAVSYEAGEERLMDPRDLANPMMFHGCHGNDLGNILNRLYSAGLVDGNDLTQILRSDSIDLMNMFNGDDDGEPVLQLLENLYYRALTDNTWKKAHIQRGFRKSGLRPRIYSLATNMQIQNAGALGGFKAPGPFEGDLNIDPLDPEDSGFTDLTDPTVNPVRYFTPRTVPLGWLDTRQVIPYVPDGNVGDVPFGDLDDTIAGLVRGKTIWNELPKIFMGVILMPPAYRIEQYFRVIINHAFAFKGFRGISMSNDMLGMPPNYENWNELLSDGDSDPDPPEPDPPEPEPPEPEPTYEYPAVFLSDPTTDGYRTASYVRSADDTMEPSKLTFISGENNNRFSVTQNPSSPRYHRISARFIATDGTYDGDSLEIATGNGSNVVLFVNNVQGTTIANAAGVIDIVAGSLDNSEYFMAYRGDDLYNMFLTANVYIEDENDSRRMKKWTPTLEPSKS